MAIPAPTTSMSGEASPPWCSARPRRASPIRCGKNGATLLDDVWDQAPFDDHGELVEAVSRVAAAWRSDAIITQAEEEAIVGAAERAEDL